MPPKNWMIAAAGAVPWPCPSPKNRVGKQQTEARAGVGLQQEQDRLALFSGLLDAQRGQHAMVDGVVEEQHLGRLDDDAGQRQQAVFDQPVHAAAEGVGEPPMTGPKT